MQYTTTLGSNPFGVLTSVVAPAILTNACFGAGAGDQQPPGASCGPDPGGGGGTCGIRGRGLEVHRQVRATGSVAGARANSPEGGKGFLCGDRTVCRCGSGRR